MSTNDDSASRRGRRAQQGESDWRAASRQRSSEGWDQPSQSNRDTARENPPQQAAYSAFRRPSYSQPYEQPRQELPPPAPQSQRAFEPSPALPQSYYPEPPRALEPPQAPQSYYPEPAARQEAPRAYVEPAAPYSPPPAPYEPNAQIPYGGTGSDLFGGDAGHHAYEQDPYGGQPAYRAEVYDVPPARAPVMQPGAAGYQEQDYRQREEERLFNARIAQESGASRFYLSGEQPERGPLPAPQAAADRYPAAPVYNSGGYGQHPAPHESYDHGEFGHRVPGQESWHGDEHRFAGDDPRSHLPQAIHGDEFDEEFPDEDFEADDYAPPRKSRKKLLLAVLASAVAVAAGGSYAYKAMTGAKEEKATPLIHADRTPPKEVPDNPGGRQFPHGEKAIYERLTPDGRTQVAAFTPAAAPVAAPLTATGPGGTSLEDRIDEALKRAQSTGDAPASPGRPNADQPTVVHSESYRPDGTRADTRPVITPNIVSVENGLPYPFGNATSAPAAQPQSAPRAAPVAAPQQFSTATAPAAKPAPVRIASHSAPPAETAAAAVPAAAGGFYVSLKSAPDEKAIQKDIPALTDKYKPVLGEVQISSKIADLGAKGVTYRAVAGPLGTRQEALDLCQKIKGVGGDKACFVTN